MRIDILTVLPGLLKGPFTESIVKRGIEKGLVEVHIHDIRKYTKDKHNRVDDTPFGGAAGMVLAIQPIHDAIVDLQSEREYNEVIFLTPDGEDFGPVYHVRDGSTFIFDKGYHPCVAAPGFEMYYFTILAGESQRPLHMNYQKEYAYQLETIPGMQDMLNKFK